MLPRKIPSVHSGPSSSAGGNPRGKKWSSSTQELGQTTTRRVRRVNQRKLTCFRTLSGAFLECNPSALELGILDEQNLNRKGRRRRIEDREYLRL